MEWTILGDIRSENDDTSNEKSCEKHVHFPYLGFLHLVNLRRVNRSLRNPQKGFVRWVHESDVVDLYDYSIMHVYYSKLEAMSYFLLPN